MPTCPQCESATPEDATACPACGAALAAGGADDASSSDPDASPFDPDADFDPEARRERFENRFGIDLGDRTVDEYLTHLDRQDYSLTAWVGLVAAAQLVGVALFALTVSEAVDPGLPAELAFPAVSVAMAVGIFGDTRAVGQFRPWAKIRWTYVLVSAVPLVGHIGAFLYLVLRRLMHEETVKHRRRLLNAGFDLRADPGEA